MTKDKKKKKPENAVKFPTATIRLIFNSKRGEHEARRLMAMFQMESPVRLAEPHLLHHRKKRKERHHDALEGQIPAVFEASLQNFIDVHNAGCTHHEDEITAFYHP